MGNSESSSSAHFRKPSTATAADYAGPVNINHSAQPQHKTTAHIHSHCSHTDASEAINARLSQLPKTALESSVHLIRCAPTPSSGSAIAPTATSRNSPKLQPVEFSYQSDCETDSAVQQVFPTDGSTSTPPNPAQLTPVLSSTSAASFNPSAVHLNSAVILDVVHSLQQHFHLTDRPLASRVLSAQIELMKQIDQIERLLSSKLTLRQRGQTAQLESLINELDKSNSLRSELNSCIDNVTRCSSALDSLISALPEHTQNEILHTGLPTPKRLSSSTES